MNGHDGADKHKLNKWDLKKKKKTVKVLILLSTNIHTNTLHALEH